MALYRNKYTKEMQSFSEDYVFDKGVWELVAEFEGERADTPVCKKLKQVDLSALNQQVGGSHYKDFKVQPVVFIHENGIKFIPGNIIKYICRYENKNGIEDLKKARHYIDMLIEMEEKKC